MATSKDLLTVASQFLYHIDRTGATPRSGKCPQTMGRLIAARIAHDAYNPLSPDTWAAWRNTTLSHLGNEDGLYNFEDLVTLHLLGNLALTVVKRTTSKRCARGILRDYCRIVRQMYPRSVCHRPLGLEHCLRVIKKIRQCSVTRIHHKC